MGRESEGLEDVGAVGTGRDRVEDRVISVMTTTGKGYMVLVAVLSMIVLWGIYAYTVQLRDGLIVTGLRDRIMWGFYISNFVFVIGISYGGTLISAVLRITSAEWRRPITRMAEGIAVVCLAVGMLFPIMDLGRPDRALNVIIYGRWQSPIIWDIAAISTYLVASLLFLFVLMIPDMAVLSERKDRLSRWRRSLYKLLGIGWIGNNRQRRIMARVGMMMAIFIIPLAISVHTVLAWLFAMNLREGWHSTIFGPFFVVGAVYSGVATIIVMTAVARKVYHLEEYIQPKHFIYLGYILAALSLAMIYMNVAEHLTAGYTLPGESQFHLDQLFNGRFAPFFWFVIIGGFIVPSLIVLMPWTRNVWGIVVASILVILAMGAERYYLVVSGLRTPQMPYEPADYVPSWVEISVVSGAFALVALLLTLFVKIFPLLPIWEMTEDDVAPAAPGEGPVGVP